MDRGAWWAAVHWVPKSQTGLSDQHFHNTFMPRSGHETCFCFRVRLDSDTWHSSTWDLSVLVYMLWMTRKSYLFTKLI